MPSLLRLGGAGLSRLLGVCDGLQGLHTVHL